MSRDTVVSTRYAKALFEAASENGTVEETEQELKAIVEAFTHDADLRNFIATPNVSFEDKRRVLETAFAGKVSQPLVHTITLLIERGRYGIFSELLNSYTAIVSRTLKVVDAFVYTPYPLDEREQAEVTARFGQLSGKRIRVQNIVDKTLLGGLKVVIGDMLYDGSLSGKLNRLEKSFQRQAQ